MNVPVKIALKNATEKISTVMDDELHQLVLEGQVSFKDAIQALRDAGLELDKRFYPWLRYVENLVTGEFDQEPVAKANVPQSEPDLLSAKAEKAVKGADTPKPEPKTNPEGAD